MARDFFGRLIKKDIMGREIPRKQLKREIIAENRKRGAAAEKAYKIHVALQGGAVERTGKGHDFKVYRKNILAGKKEFVGYREIKSSRTAPLSKLQKKKSKQLKGKYKVIRQNPGLY